MNLILRTIIWVALFFLLRHEVDALWQLDGFWTLFGSIPYIIPPIVFLEWADEGDRRRGVVRVPVGDYGYRRQVLQHISDQQRR